MPALHITNGDHAGDKLRSFVDGPVALACDVLHEGPCPAVDGDAWHDVRARFLSPARADEVKASLAASDQAIAEACLAKASAERPAIVLWFEHDLFDQLAIVRTLDLMARVRPDTTGMDVSLICIDRFPGIDRFIGLGQLTAGQLATLAGTGVPVTADHHATASAAWNAFRSTDPRGLLAIRASGALPFLRQALRRFLAEYPSTSNGLSRTEELALRGLTSGAMTGGRLFGATQSREAAPFMGDSTFFDLLQRLASARVPLVAIGGRAGGADLRAQPMAITDAGVDVLEGRADHVRLNGIDLWRGGVHLVGSDRSPWRWDARAETLVS